MFDFGYLYREGLHFPDAPTYHVHFENGFVTNWHTPMGDNDMAGGVPSVPTPSLPQDNSRFTHSPRIVDLRWRLSTGDYPIKYEVQFKSVDEANPDRETIGELLSSDVPYLAVRAPSGWSKHMWRVRAANAGGMSDWSAWQTFYFE